MKSVYLRFEECVTDPVQYKPYSPRLVGENIYVKFDIPDDTVLVGASELPPTAAVVLTPEGVCAILSQMAKAIRFNISAKYETD